MELGKGEALVSFLEGNGTPSMVERVMIRPPTARLEDALAARGLAPLVYADGYGRALAATGDP